MPNSKLRCRHCKDYFAREQIQEHPKGFCTFDHAVEFGLKKAKEKREKQRKAKHAADLKRVRRNPRAEALIAAQLLARISRADDDGYCTCVTCGKVGKYNDGFDGGHFIAKSKSTYWMLDPRNIHPQCKACNGDGMKFHGKEVDYTLWMIDHYGREFVEQMKEQQRTIIKRSTADYDAYIAKAKAEIAQHKKRIGF